MLTFPTKAYLVSFSEIVIIIFTISEISFSSWLVPLHKCNVGFTMTMFSSGLFDTHTRSLKSNNCIAMRQAYVRYARVDMEAQEIFFFLLKEIIAKSWEWNHLGCVFPWCGQCDLTRPPHWRNRPIYPDPIFATWESWALREVARNWMKENRRAADLVDQQSSWPTMWQQHQQYTLTTKTPSRVTTTRNEKFADMAA